MIRNLTGIMKEYQIKFNSLSEKFRQDEFRTKNDKNLSYNGVLTRLLELKKSFNSSATELSKQYIPLLKKELQEAKDLIGQRRIKTVDKDKMNLINTLSLINCSDSDIEALATKTQGSYILAKYANAKFGDRVPYINADELMDNILSLSNMVDRVETEKNPFSYQGKFLAYEGNEVGTVFDCDLKVSKFCETYEK